MNLKYLLSAFYLFVNILTTLCSDIRRIRLNMFNTELYSRHIRSQELYLDSREGYYIQFKKVSNRGKEKKRFSKILSSSKVFAMNPKVFKAHPLAPSLGREGGGSMCISPAYSLLPVMSFLLVSWFIRKLLENIENRKIYSASSLHLSHHFLSSKSRRKSGRNYTRKNARKFERKIRKGKNLIENPGKKRNVG